MSGATISSCKVVDSAAGTSEVSASSLRSGEVKYAEAYAGGIAGENNECEVTDCSFSGTVTSFGVKVPRIYTAIPLILAASRRLRLCRNTAIWGEAASPAASTW